MKKTYIIPNIDVVSIGKLYLLGGSTLPVGEEPKDDATEEETLSKKNYFFNGWDE